MDDSGHYTKEFFELADSYQDRLTHAGEHTDLPYLPDIGAIEDLLVELNERNLAMMN